ncbi:MAG TPA: serine/threonine-protein kinase, partial [Planctomycetaceae bacterium]|nr:serine/threonine-protein kinase [Planctomycetaceae bacterium]
MNEPPLASEPSCDQIRWDDFLAGGLTPPVETQVVNHLDTCPACQHRVETLAGEARWWRDSQLYLSPERADVGAGPISLPDGIDDAEEGDQPPEIRLDFLAPTDDPQSLGRLGAYEVRGVIGRGGTGIVVKAFDRSLHRFVAIKVLDPHLAGNAAARKRFAREGRAAAAVAHEQIVPIHAVNEQQGLPYIVMQYVPGRSLQQRIDQEGPLALADVLRIGLQTAQGLAAAHAQGLVHRDVKPANILLENGIERVLLTDFGLARTIDEASLTQSGVIAGTPQYMAPEQALGETVDHRTDLFSLGSVLYAM